jgi:Putative auto-transporter adhesin, head GIN domain
MKMIRALALLVLLPLHQSAMAAERGYSTTDFGKIRVEGNYIVSVVTGKSGSARSIGSAKALERISIDVQNRTLVIKPVRFNWGSAAEGNPGPVTIKVTAHDLDTAILSGAGSLTIDKMRGGRLSVINSGSSTLTVEKIEADRIDVSNSGSGTVQLSGSAQNGQVTVNGSASLNAPSLSVADLIVVAQTSGRVQISARRSAKVTSAGAGTVEIGGKPACTVNTVGAGVVSCGGATH